MQDLTPYHDELRPTVLPAVAASSEMRGAARVALAMNPVFSTAKTGVRLLELAADPARLAGTR